MHERVCEWESVCMRECVRNVNCENELLIE